ARWGPRAAGPVPGRSPRRGGSGSADATGSTPSSSTETWAGSDGEPVRDACSPAPRLFAPPHRRPRRRARTRRGPDRPAAAHRQRHGGRDGRRRRRIERAAARGVRRAPAGRPAHGVVGAVLRQRAVARLGGYGATTVALAQ